MMVTVIDEIEEASSSGSPRYDGYTPRPTNPTAKRLQTRTITGAVARAKNSRNEFALSMVAGMDDPQCDTFTGKLAERTQFDRGIANSPRRQPQKRAAMHLSRSSKSVLPEGKPRCYTKRFIPRENRSVRGAYDDHRREAVDCVLPQGFRAIMAHGPP